jgi:hypothetical protein
MEAVKRQTDMEDTMKLKTSLKASGRRMNHNKMLVRDAGRATGRGLKVETNLKAGLSGTRR